jgi:hypothetical protein
MPLSSSSEFFMILCVRFALGIYDVQWIFSLFFGGGSGSPDELVYLV